MFSIIPLLLFISYPDDVTSVGRYAFNHCDQLTAITLPAKVDTIGEGAFASCDKLKEITVDSDNTSYCDQDGVLFNSDCTTLIQCPGRWDTAYTIPDTVTDIKNYAFEGYRELPSVVVPESVTTIGTVFSQCYGLTSITLLNTITTIEENAFSGCFSLSSFSIPESVTSIGAYAFSNCSALISISISEGVTSIEEGAFSGCSALTTFEVDENNPNYCVIDDVLFSKDQTSLIQYPIGKEDTSYHIPESVQRIGASSFYTNNLTSVTIPDGVTSIGTSAFSYSALSELNLLGSVEIIENNAFSGCHFPSLTLPEGLESIGWCAFLDCEELRSVSIPASVTSIEGSPFAGCNSLTAITVDANNKNYCSVDDLLLTKDKTALVQYPSGKEDTEYTIPKSVTEIKGGSFYECEVLESLTIGEQVESIEGGAFWSNNAFTGFVIQCYVGSAAMEYALENNIEYVLLTRPSRNLTVAVVDENGDPVQKENFTVIWYNESSEVEGDDSATLTGALQAKTYYCDMWLSL